MQDSISPITKCRFKVVIAGNSGGTASELRALAISGLDASIGVTKQKSGSHTLTGRAPQLTTHLTRLRITFPVGAAGWNEVVKWWNEVSDLGKPLTKRNLDVLIYDGEEELVQKISLQSAWPCRFGFSGASQEDAVATLVQYLDFIAESFKIEATAKERNLPAPTAPRPAPHFTIRGLNFGTKNIGSHNQIPIGTHNQLKGQVDAGGPLTGLAAGAGSGLIQAGLSGQGGPVPVVITDPKRGPEKSGQVSPGATKAAGGGTHSGTDVTTASGNGSANSGTPASAPGNESSPSPAEPAPAPDEDPPADPPEGRTEHSVDPLATAPAVALFAGFAAGSLNERTPAEPSVETPSFSQPPAEGTTVPEDPGRIPTEERENPLSSESAGILAAGLPPGGISFPSTPAVTPALPEVAAGGTIQEKNPFSGSTATNSPKPGLRSTTAAVPPAPSLSPTAPTPSPGAAGSGTEGRLGNPEAEASKEKAVTSSGAHSSRERGGRAETGDTVPLIIFREANGLTRSTLNSLRDFLEGDLFMRRECGNWRRPVAITYRWRLQTVKIRCAPDPTERLEFSIADDGLRALLRRELLLRFGLFAPREIDGQLIEAGVEDAAEPFAQ